MDKFVTRKSRMPLAHTHHKETILQWVWISIDERVRKFIPHTALPVIPLFSSMPTPTPTLQSSSHSCVNYNRQDSWTLQSLTDRSSVIIVYNTCPCVDKILHSQAASRGNTGVSVKWYRNWEICFYDALSMLRDGRVVGGTQIVSYTEVRKWSSAIGRRRESFMQVRWTTLNLRKRNQ